LVFGFYFHFTNLEWFTTPNSDGLYFVWNVEVGVSVDEEGT